VTELTEDDYSFLPEQEAACPVKAGLSEAMTCVSRFHEAFGLPRASRPGSGIPAGLAKLRVDLLVEETGEFAEASVKGDIVGIADALADIVYVAYGAAVTYGIDLDAALREVHRSNMSKLDDQGRPVYREDGKVLKSARYTPPDISGILSRQPPLSF
jgi:predicted HAD superfamily Cof-like phosphohydrolase